jgi:hypothetical protein
MKNTTSVQSNAFNFSEFLSSGVDPRTGMFTANLKIFGSVLHKSSGQGLQLSIGYSPMNTQDSGFGRGWSFPLTPI